MDQFPQAACIAAQIRKRVEEVQCALIRLKTRIPWKGRWNHTIHDSKSFEPMACDGAVNKLGVVNDQVGSGRYRRGTASGRDVKRCSNVMQVSRFQNGNGVPFGFQARGIRRNRRRLAQKKGSEGALQVIHGVVFREGLSKDVPTHCMRLGRRQMHGERVRESHERKVRQRSDQPAQQYAGEQ